MWVPPPQISLSPLEGGLALRVNGHRERERVMSPSFWVRFCHILTQRGSGGPHPKVAPIFPRIWSWGVVLSPREGSSLGVPDECQVEGKSFQLWIPGTLTPIQGLSPALQHLSASSRRDTDPCLTPFSSYQCLWKPWFGLGGISASKQGAGTPGQPDWE